MAAGAYRVEFWDTLTGQITGTQMKELKANEALTLDLPPFETDLAVKVKRNPDTPGAPGYQPAPESVPFVERGEKPPVAPGTKKR